MTLQLYEDNSLPLYRRIMQSVRQAIAQGELTPGQKLPARQTLARELGVNMVTVRHAYELLEQEQILVSRHGSGTYVRDDVVRENRVATTARIGQRRYKSITVIVGEPEVADCGRTMNHVVNDILAGVSKALSPHVPVYRFATSLDRQSLAHLTERDAVLYKHADTNDLGMIDELASRNIPLLGVWGGVNIPIAYVDYDHWHATALAPRYLIDRGYTRLGFIGVKGNNLALGVGFFGFVNTLHEAGLSYKASHVMDVLPEVPGVAYSAVLRMLRAGDLPEALVMDSDMKALEAITALTEAGLRVPEDIAVVGFNGIPDISTIAPRLTTVYTGRREVGQEAGRLLAQWPETLAEAKQVKTLELKAKMMEGDTVLPHAVRQDVSNKINRP